MTDKKLILPVTELTSSNLADFFDERNIINDDLNMYGYFIYNLRDPEDDQDAVTKIYVDLKKYHINSANIYGNLPWSRLDNIPQFFPSKISMLNIDSNLDLGSYVFLSTKIPTLDNHLTNKLYVDTHIFTNDNFAEKSINGSKLIDGSISNSKISNNAIGTSKIADLQVTDAKIVDIASSKIIWDQSGRTDLRTHIMTSTAAITDINQFITKGYIDANLVWSKILNKPPYYPSQVSSLLVDTNLNMSNYKVTGLPTPVDTSDAATKAYVDSKSAVVTYDKIGSSTATNGAYIGPIGNQYSRLYMHLGSNYRSDAVISVCGTLTNVSDPVNYNDAATKNYVDYIYAPKMLNSSGTTMNLSSSIYNNNSGTFTPAITWNTSGYNQVAISGSYYLFTQKSGTGNLIAFLQDAYGTNATYGTYGFNATCDVNLKHSIEDKSIQAISEKDYFARILETPVMSFVYKTDKSGSIVTGTDAKKLFEIYNQNTCHKNKTLTKSDISGDFVGDENCKNCPEGGRCEKCYLERTYTVNTNTMLWYSYLGMQSFYHQYYKPLEEKVKTQQTIIEDLQNRLLALESKHNQ